MTTLELLLLAPLLLALLVLLSVAVRHRSLQRAGAVEVSLRLRARGDGRGWSNGVARFVDDELRWYRVFSLSFRPKRTLSRRDLRVIEQRSPSSAEQRALQAGAVVLLCRRSTGPVELAMQPGATTGVLAWLEARPPGATLPG